MKVAGAGNALFSKTKKAEEARLLAAMNNGDNITTTVAPQIEIEGTQVC